jgi:hypothetical protein
MISKLFSVLYVWLRRVWEYVTVKSQCVPFVMLSGTSLSVGWSSFHRPGALVTFLISFIAALPRM